MSTITKSQIAAVLLVTLLFVPYSHAAVQTRAELKTRFENGDIPDGQDFKDVIDSALNFHDDGLTIYRVGADSSLHATRFDAGATIGVSTNFSLTSPLPPLAPNWLGQFGFLPLELQDTAGLSHYAFLMQMASGPASLPPGTPGPGPAISVQYLVYESEAGVPLTTFVSSVPEPTSIVVFCCVAIGAFAIRRYYTI